MSCPHNCMRKLNKSQQLSLALLFTITFDSMNKLQKTNLILIVGLAILLALLVRELFGIESLESLYSVMSIAFIFFLPAGVGALTIYLSKRESVEKFSYRFFMPWLPVFGFFVITIALSMEGWACWIMIMPVFLIASSIGGLIAGYYKLRKNKNEKLYISCILLMPFFIAPIEQVIGKIPGKYKAYTSIDIRSSKEKIWNNVTEVKTITEPEDKGWLTKKLGFPRPIKAALNYRGVGGSRNAVFDKGLVFNETVLAYEPERKMVFSIKANTHDIPSTTMDEHVVVGGKYFDVLRGTYELEQIDSATCRLHLYSEYKLSTTFNFYAGFWAGLIMKDIQKNILEVIKNRAEKNN